MSAFEQFVRQFVEISRLHARTIERTLWVVFALMLLAMLAAGITQSFG